LHRQPSSNEFYTNNIHQHKPLSFCIVIKWTDNVVPPETITYTAENDDKDVGQIFIVTLERNVQRIYKIQQKKKKQFKDIKKEDRKNMNLQLNLQLLVISARKNWVKIES